MSHSLFPSSKSEWNKVAVKWALEISLTQKLLSILRYILDLATLNLGIATYPWYIVKKLISFLKSRIS